MRASAFSSRCSSCSYLYFNPKGGSDLRGRVVAIDFFIQDLSEEDCSSATTNNYLRRDTGRNANDKDAFYIIPQDLNNKVIGIGGTEDKPNCQVRVVRLIAADIGSGPTTAASSFLSPASRRCASS